VGLAPSAVHERLKKLREHGLIHRIVARLDAPKLGFGLLAFVRVRTDEPLGGKSVTAQLAAIPEVLEIHDVAGEDCYLLKVVAENIERLHTLLRERIGKLKCVSSTSTTIVLKTVKDTTALPIDPEPAKPIRKKPRRS